MWERKKKTSYCFQPTEPQNWFLISINTMRVFVYVCVSAENASYVLSSGLQIAGFLLGDVSS